MSKSKKEKQELEEEPFKIIIIEGHKLNEETGELEPVKIKMKVPKRDKGE